MNHKARNYSTFEPETRLSFLNSVSNAEPAAWRKFHELYGPIIFSYARRKGLQDADAHELLQDVLLQVYKYLPSFEYDQTKGRFRAWLQTVTKNQVAKFFRSKGRKFEINDSEGILDFQSSENGPESRLLRNVVTQAQEEIRDSFHPDTWRAFELTWNEQVDVATTAKQLNRTVGWVYVAKSRVLKKLTEQVVHFFDDDSE